MPTTAQNFSEPADHSGVPSGANGVAQTSATAEIPPDTAPAMAARMIALRATERIDARSC
jgi:hypothetical protein